MTKNTNQQLYEQIYKQFKKLQAQKGVSIYKIAQDTHIGRSTLSDWETKKTNPKLDKLLAIADYFEVSFDYLLGRSDENNLSADKIELLPEYIKYSLNILNSNEVVSMNGAAIDEEKRKALAEVLENSIKCIVDILES